MNKMTHLKFNLNNFLFALSEPLNLIHMPNLHKVPFSSKRVAYMALKIAKLNMMDDAFISDLLSYSLIAHNQVLKSNLELIPFNDINNVKNEEMTKIISLCSFVELQLNIEGKFTINKNEVINFIECKDCFDEIYLENLLYLMEYDSFWFDLSNSSVLPFKILDMVNDFSFEYEYSKLIPLSKLFYTIYNDYTNRIPKTSISDKLSLLCEHYNFDEKDSARMLISAYLSYLGFLYMPQEQLTTNDLKFDKEIFKAVPYYTNDLLSKIYGFDDIATLSSCFNENIDGSGYPYKKMGHELSLKFRLFSIVYRLQALEELRVYRNAYETIEIFEILKKEAQDGLLDMTLVQDIINIMDNENKNFQKE